MQYPFALLNQDLRIEFRNRCGHAIDPVRIPLLHTYRDVVARRMRCVSVNVRRCMHNCHVRKVDAYAATPIGHKTII